MFFKVRKLAVFLVFLVMYQAPLVWAAGPNSKNEMYATFGLKFGQGTSGSQDGVSLVERSFLVPAVDMVLGYRMGYFILGAEFDYALWQQQTDPKDINDSNTQGSVMLLSPVFGLRYGSFRILVRTMPLLSQYALSKANSAGQKSEYGGGSLMGLQLHVATKNDRYWGLEYTTMKFTKQKLAGVESEIASGKEIESKLVGVVYGFQF